MASALADLQVIECGGRTSVSVCGKLLAELGAQVLKVEPTTGDLNRQAGPFPEDQPHPERSGLFAYLNRGKKSVTIDLELAAGRQVLRRLAAGAHILIAGERPIDLQRYGLLYDDLAAVNSQLVCTAITPFGLTGPYRDYADSELVIAALSGVGYYVPGGTESPSTTPPVLAGAQIAAYSAGVQAAGATLTAALACQAGLGGQQVDISEQEVLLDSLRMHLATYAYNGENPSRALGGRRMGGAAYWRCADGYVWGFPAAANSEYAWFNLIDVMGNPEWTLDPQLLDAEYRSAHWDEIVPRIREWVSTMPKAELADAFQRRHVGCLPVSEITDLLQDEHLAARGAFVPLDQPDLDGAIVPAGPIHFDGKRISASGPAPKLGEHTREALAESGFSEEEQRWLYRAAAVR